MTSITLKLLNDRDFKITASIGLYSRLFTNQSSNLLISHKKALVESQNINKQIISLLIILILSIFFINQQFSNALFDIYFNIKSEPIFNTFQQVCNNQEISVKTTLLNTYGKSLDQVCNLEMEKRSNFEVLALVIYSCVFLSNENELIKIKLDEVDQSYIDAHCPQLFDIFCLNFQFPI